MDLSILEALILEMATAIGEIRRETRARLSALEQRITAIEQRITAMEPARTDAATSATKRWTTYLSLMAAVMKVLGSLGPLWIMTLMIWRMIRSWLWGPG